MLKGEEIKDASRVTPKAIMSAICLNGCLGFIVVVTYCFALGDITELLTPATGYPFIQVFYNVTQSYTGATLLTSVLIVTITSACISNLATASRQLWSFSRDRGMPFSSTLAYVRHHNRAFTSYSRELLIVRIGPSGVEYSA